MQTWKFHYIMEILLSIKFETSCLKHPNENNMEWAIIGWEIMEGRDESERHRAESQWIVAARPLCHLQYPVAYLSRLQRILPAA